MTAKQHHRHFGEVSYIKCFLEASYQHCTPYSSLFTAFVCWIDGEIVTKTILSLNKGPRCRHFVFGPQEACSLFGDFSYKTFCGGFVVALYYQYSFLNTCYLLNWLRKHKESALKLNKGYRSAAILVTDIHINSAS